MANFRVIGLGGAVAARSVSLAALKLALVGAEQAGAETQLFDLNQLQLPMYSPDIQTPPEAVTRMCEAIYGAQAMIWSTPLYHGSISGAFKNAVDWMHLLKDRTPPYLTNMVIGLVTTGGGTQGLDAIKTMESMVRTLYGWAVPLVMPLARVGDGFNSDGEVINPALESQLHALGAEVVRAVRQYATDGWCDYADGRFVPSTPRQHKDVVDEGSDLSFPASDPPAH
jgi:FMN reductase